MRKPFIGNEDAYCQLKGYLNMPHPGPLILYGKKGLGKRLAAKETASILLGCDKKDLEHNGDFFLLDKEDESIKVEDILFLLDKSNFTALGAYKVYIICHAEKMNAQAQNKLLKLLEDKNKTNIVILLCERDMLLETIKSRCLIISFNPLSEKEMSDYLIAKGMAEEDSYLAGFICGNCPYHWDEVSEYFPQLRKISRQILAISRKEELFRVFRLVQEKDAEEFYSLHAKHYPEALSMLQYLFFSALCAKSTPQKTTPDRIYQKLESLYTIQELYAICSEIAKHQKQWLISSYSKNDFFDLVRSMVQVIS